MKEKLKKFIKNPFVQMIAVLGLLALVPSMLIGSLRGDNWFGKSFIRESIWRKRLAWN